MTPAYDALCEHFRQLHNLHHLAAICGWDQATMMPPGGNEARSAAMAELAVRHHQHLTDPHVGDWIARAEEEPLAPQQLANLRECKRQWQQASVLPAELVQAKSLSGSRCEHAWREQRKHNDWQGFMPNLKEVVKLSREEATIRAATKECSLYDSLLDLYEPDMTGQRLDALFSNLKTWLPKLIQQVTEKQANETVHQPQGPFPVERQRLLGLKVMRHLGFDFNRGRLDISIHPFCGGVPEDVRITTRYKEDDFTHSLMGIIHETGHASYEQNLPQAWLSQPCGQARSMAVHESQSLLFEMQLGRDPAFLAWLTPQIRQELQVEDAEVYNADNLARLYTRVKPGLIRVDADELTYPTHIMLRYEIERALIESDIEVEDIPELWDRKMQQYLGLSTQDNFRDGCMQDIHWTDGSFGYFPSYTLGAMYAAQLFAAIRQEIDALEAKIFQCDLQPILDWLRHAVWQQASLLETDELLQQATGEKLNPDWFRQHLEQRYLT